MRHVEESPKPRAPQHVIDTLKGVERVLSLKTASFSADPAEDLKIKRAIKSWVGSWSLGPVEDLLAWAQGAPGVIDSNQDGQRFYPRGSWTPPVASAGERG